MIEAVSKGLKLKIMDVDFGFPILRGTAILSGSGFGRQPEAELKQEADTAPEISRVEAENLEARVLTHKLSSSGLERGVIAESYQGSMPAASNPAVIGVGFPRSYHYPYPASRFISIDPARDITYVHYVDSAQAGVLYITEQPYESNHSIGLNAYSQSEISRCQEPPATYRRHDARESSQLDEPAVLEHAQKYTAFQNWNVDLIHWLETSGIFLTYQEIYHPDNRPYGMFAPRIVVTDYRTSAQQGNYSSSETDISPTKTENIEVMGFADLVNLRVKDAMPRVVEEGEPDVEIVAPELRALDGSQTRPDETDYLSNVHPLEPNYILTAFMPEVAGTDVSTWFAAAHDVLRAEGGQETYETSRPIIRDYILPVLDTKLVPTTAARDVPGFVEGAYVGRLRIQDYASPRLSIDMMPEAIGTNVFTEVPTASTDETLRAQEERQAYGTNKAFTSDSHHDLTAFMPEVAGTDVSTWFAAAHDVLRAEDDQEIHQINRVITPDYLLPRFSLNTLPEFKDMSRVVGQDVRVNREVRAQSMQELYELRTFTLDEVDFNTNPDVVSASNYVPEVRVSDILRGFAAPVDDLLKVQYSPRPITLDVISIDSTVMPIIAPDSIGVPAASEVLPEVKRAYEDASPEFKHNMPHLPRYSVMDRDLVIQPAHYRQDAVEISTDQGIVEVKLPERIGFDDSTLRDGFKGLQWYEPDNQEITTLTNQLSEPVAQSSFLTQDYSQFLPNRVRDAITDISPNKTVIQLSVESTNQPDINTEYSNYLLTNTNLAVNPEVSSVEQPHLERPLQTDTYQDSDSQNQIGPISCILSAIEPATQSEHQEDVSSRPSDLDYNYAIALTDFESPAKKQDEPLEPKRKSEQCYTKPKLNDFIGFEEIKKGDFYDQEKTKQACPVKLNLVERLDTSFAEYEGKHFEDKVKSNECDIIPHLKELGYLDSDTKVKWFSLFDAPVDITSKLIDNGGIYALRVKGKDTDFERPYYESKSATYITQANSGVAIVDKLIRQLGLNPVWEVEHEITDDKEISSGKVYLKDIMGVKEAAKELLEAHVGGIDFIIRFYDKKTGEVELRALEDVLSMEDIESEKYRIDVVAQARVHDSSVSQTKRQFKEEISAGYETPVLEDIVYREGLKREEPLSGTGGIDEFIPEAGDIYDVVIASQGVYDRESKDIKGAYSLLKFKVSEEDLTDDSDYIMTVKDKNGFDKLYRTKANNLSAILDKKLKEYGLKGVFVEIDTHKDREGESYQIGGELNNTTIYLAGVEGAMTKFMEKNPDAMPHEMGILIEKLQYSCGGGRFDEFHNPVIYDQKREKELRKSA